MEPTTLGSVTARKKKKSIDTLGEQKEISPQGGFGFTVTVPTLISSFSLRPAIALFRFPVNKYIQ